MTVLDLMLICRLAKNGELKNFMYTQLKEIYQDFIDKHEYCNWRPLYEQSRVEWPYDNAGNCIDLTLALAAKIQSEFKDEIQLTVTQSNRHSALLANLEDKTYLLDPTLFHLSPIEIPANQNSQQVLQNGFFFKGYDLVIDINGVSQIEVSKFVLPPHVIKPTLLGKHCFSSTSGLQDLVIKRTSADYLKSAAATFRVGGELKWAGVDLSNGFSYTVCAGITDFGALDKIAYSFGEDTHCWRGIIKPGQKIPQEIDKFSSLIEDVRSRMEKALEYY